jgi:hypothetical protein
MQIADRDISVRLWSAMRRKPKPEVGLVGETMKYRSTGKVKSTAHLQNKMDNLLKKIDEQVQWFCDEYEHYPKINREQKKYREGLSLILIDFTNAIKLWEKGVRIFPRKEQKALSGFLRKLGKLFEEVGKAKSPQIEVATLQAILRDIKLLSKRSRAQLTNCR